MTLIILIAFLTMITLAINYFKYRRGFKWKWMTNILVGLAILFVSFSISGCSNDSTNKKDADNVKVVKKTKYIGKDKYKIAKKENVALVSKKEKLVKQQDDLQAQKDKIISDEAQAEKSAQEQQAAADKQAQENQKQQEKQQQEQANEQAQSSSSQQRGDMNTRDSGQIVGNINSHIYHVPGQSGYNMNSANATYFNTEQDAINAGYRRAKR